MKRVVPWMLLAAVIGCQGSEPDDRPAEVSSSPPPNPLKPLTPGPTTHAHARPRGIKFPISDLKVTRRPESASWS